VGPRAGLDRCGKYGPPPGFDPRTVQPVASRYTDSSIPAHLNNGEFKKIWLSLKFFSEFIYFALNSNGTGHLSCKLVVTVVMTARSGEPRVYKV
jgi:hypothetical protein